MEDEVDPLTHALRRAVGAVGLAMVTDEVEEGKTLLAAWPVLEGLDPERWIRLQTPGVFGEHEALADLGAIASALVQYDEAAVRRLCVQADRWASKVLTAQGGTADPEAESRRQTADATATAGVERLIPEVLELEAAAALLHRIDARL
ncbi:MAG: hypothetical protein KC621_06495, partial [Myxococcales bacterium]|nr:hypothetical protein [Myxococcales bacterium]